MGLSRGGRRSRLLLGEDLLPPIGAGGRDPSVMAETLADRYVAFHWLSRQATHQRRARSTMLHPPSPDTLSGNFRPATLAVALAPTPCVQLDGGNTTRASDDSGLRQWRRPLRPTPNCAEVVSY